MCLLSPLSSQELDPGVGFAWPGLLADRSPVRASQLSALHPKALRSLCTGVGLNLLSNIHSNKYHTVLFFQVK